MGKGAIRLAIQGEISSVDNAGKQLKYMFRVSPLVPNSGVFVFMMYCFSYERERGNTTERTILARQLREKHTALWKRYRAWTETL